MKMSDELKLGEALYGAGFCTRTAETTPMIESGVICRVLLYVASPAGGP